MRRVIDAVLFDWFDTLMPCEEVTDAAFARERTQAGLSALARDGLPAAEAIDEWFRGRLDLWEGEDEVDFLAVVGECFSELGCPLAAADVRVYAEAAQWESELLLHPQTHALLDSLRARGLKLGLVSNTIVPGWLLEPVLQRQGLRERLDAIVLSSEVGKRKPHPLIFRLALDELGVPAERALFVGDRLVADVRGAAAAGMVTVQAMWSRADEHPDAGEPDYQAFTQMDVLNIVRRLRGER